MPDHIHLHKNKNGETKTMILLLIPSVVFFVTLATVTLIVSEIREPRQVLSVQSESE